ncbi:MAG TPA: glycosyltransferase N-terminal domain-containing protein [Prolixibacteraceae bacterium]|nr:glycosyltransferase N-terminal domain-containing protein [Prolixibacteraceae bacterium]
MKIVYNIGIYTLYLLTLIASHFNPKAKLWIRGRKGQLKKMKAVFSGSDQVVWVHCASLGEFEQGRPVIEEIKNRFPHKKVLLTFYSPSGYEVQKNYSNADFVCYLPLDTRFNIKKLIKYAKPEMVFFIKYEYWYNVLSILNKKAIPVYFVSTIFREDQLFFKSYGKWYRKMLSKASHFFLQNESSAALLDTINIKNHTITGDTRFDRVANILKNVKPLKIVEAFINGTPVIIAGSTWKSEEALLRQFVLKNQGIKVVLVPHEIENGNVDRIMQSYGDKAIKYSEATKANLKNKQVLVVDCYGILTSLYQYGQIAVVGGGFGAGIHNVLEPATFGMPIIFGPNYERFREAIDLVNQNSAFPVNNIEEFNTVLYHLLANPSTTEKIATQAAQYVKNNVGATQKILDKVF